MSCTVSGMVDEEGVCRCRPAGSCVGMSNNPLGELHDAGELDDLEKPVQANGEGADRRPVEDVDVEQQPQAPADDIEGDVDERDPYDNRTGGTPS